MLALLAASTIARPASAQGIPEAPAGAPTSLVGDWQGTSTCRPVGKPACHDEVVVYHFRPDSAAPPATAAVERLEWTLNKIVAGAEENMGVLPCTYARRTGEASCPMRGWRWHFVARGDSLVGRLENPRGVAWRDIRVRRR
ncbi:MAG TPA: hypothetical protein VGD77_09060 [Gemmatimonadaceae bacterium]